MNVFPSDGEASRGEVDGFEWFNFVDGDSIVRVEFIGVERRFLCLERSFVSIDFDTKGTDAFFFYSANIQRELAARLDATGSEQVKLTFGIARTAIAIRGGIVMNVEVKVSRKILSNHLQVQVLARFGDGVGDGIDSNDIGRLSRLHFDLVVEFSFGLVRTGKTPV